MFFRQPNPVPVTDNWQKAMSLATGDYCLMLGDDDALAPDFFETVIPHLSEDGPELVYLGAYHYAYPNVLPWSPSGYLAVVRNSEFLTDVADPFCMTPAYARELAISVFDFRCRFGMNAQHFLLKTSFVRQFDRLGGFYQSPYPDTFSAIATFSRASAVVVLPQQLVIIGISPKSFVYYYFSGRVEEGYAFLDNERPDEAVRRSLDDLIVPGDRNNTNLLVASETARRVLSPSLAANVNIGRYHLLQMAVILRGRHHLHANLDKEAGEWRAKVSPESLLLFEMLDATLEIADIRGSNLTQRVLQAIDDKLSLFSPAVIRYLDIGAHQNIGDAVAQLGKGAVSASPAAGGQRS